MLIILILTIVTSIIVTLIITKNENNSTSSNHRNETKNIISIFGDNKNWRRKGLHNDKEFMVTVKMYFLFTLSPHNSKPLNNISEIVFKIIRWIIKHTANC